MSLQILLSFTNYFEVTCCPPSLQTFRDAAYTIIIHYRLHRISGKTNKNSISCENKSLVYLISQSNQNGVHWRRPSTRPQHESTVSTLFLSDDWVWWELVAESEKNRVWYLLFFWYCLWLKKCCASVQLAVDMTSNSLSNHNFPIFHLLDPK